MDNVNWFIALILSIPIGVITNLITPYVSSIISKYSKVKRGMDIRKLQAELLWLEGYVADKGKYYMDLILDTTGYLISLSFILMVAMVGFLLIANQYVEPKSFDVGSEVIVADPSIMGIWGNRVLLFALFLFALSVIQFMNQTFIKKIVVYRYVEDNIADIKRKIETLSKQENKP